MLSEHAGQLFRTRKAEPPRRRRLRIALESLESRRLLAFSADVFADINQLGVSANVDSMVEFDGRAFFSADDGQTGSELWTSDGTVGGTTRFMDLLPGTEGSQPSNLTVVGTTLFFTARDESGEFDLWKTDGSSGGTVMVFDANEAGVYNLRDLTASGGKLFFSAYQADTDPGPGSNATGQELWVSDGTSAGTLMLLDINPDQASYDGPQELTDHNGTLFFTSYDEFFNRDLWKSNGTAGTTIKVADLNDLNTSELTSVGTNLFFAAEDVATGLELYVYNGTTTTLIDITTGIGSSSPRDITEFNGLAYFSADNGSGTRTLFSSNGTSVTAITGGTTVGDPRELTVVGTTLFFSANTAGNGRELWRTDGTTNTLVEDIVAGVGSSNPTQLTAAGGKLYFSADEPTTFGRELWRSEGAFNAASTDRLIDSYTGTGPGGAPNDGNPLDLVEVNNRLFFTTVNDSNDRELWTSQGAAASTTLVSNINPSTQSANPEQLVVFGTKIFFVANDGINGDAVWVADTAVAPGPSNPVMIDMTPGTRAESISGLSIQDGSVWFYNNLAGANAQGAIYRTDGTATTLVGQQTPIVQSSTDPNDLFTTYLGRVYFVAEDNTGVELWRSDDAGTSIARFIDLFPGTNVNDGQNGSNIGDLTVFNGKLYFAATVNLPTVGFDGFGRELWETDGTTAGTVMTADIYVDDVAGNGVIRSSNPDQLIVSGTNLFFVADSGVFVTGNGLSGGRELFVLPAGGAVKLVENVVGAGGIDPGAGGSNPVNLTDINGTLYFSANSDNDADNEPYRTDGTTTTLIQNVNTTGNIGSLPSGFTSFGGQVYFAATGTDSGRELWRTTSPTGAAQVFNVSGTSSANPSEIAATSTRLFYSAVDENQSDRELWTAGGPLANGAAQVLDLFPGVFRGGNPTDIIEVGGKVYFVGEDELSGRELFVLNEVIPSVESVVINDGSVSRSQITSVTVTFDAVVDVEPTDFVLTNIDISTQVTNVSVNISEQNSKTVAVLTFGTGGVSVVNRQGTGLLGNSLADGNYRLELLASSIPSPPTGGPGLAADLVFGGQTKSAIPNDNFYRLYGDVDADGDADFTDFANDFLPGFGTVNGNAGFRPSLDFEGDGDQDFTDFAVGFLPNFGKVRL